MKMPTAQEMRDEFHRLRTELANAEKILQPYVDAYESKNKEMEEFRDKYVTPASNELRKQRDRLGIHQIQQNMAMLSRALGGQTGQPSEAA